jgi:predicted dehydrogenase
MEAMWTRYLPQTDILRQLLDAGALGEITVCPGRTTATRYGRE